MPTHRRIAVFIDYQNCYGAARRAFHQPGASGNCGHFVPQVFASILAAKVPDSRLVHVGVYCGIADPRRDGRTAAARNRQLAAWLARAGITIVTRPLRYPRTWPAERAQEKGIDVKLAIDAIMLGIERQYDLAIIGSCDSDLAPVAEALLGLHDLEGTPDVEVIAWLGSKSRIRLSGRRLPYHVISERDYLAMRDTTDYDSLVLPAPAAV